MNFGAMATWQALLVIAAAIAAAVGLFLLKLKPPRISVPSLGLWRIVLDENRERTLWERIRRAVSLAAVVLITLAIALAVLRPQRTSGLGTNPGPGTGPGTRNPGPGTAGSRVSIVLDSSWSMLATTSSGQTRWDRAVARARALAVSAAGDDIVLSTTADGVVEGPTPDVALIEAALDRVAPSGGETSAFPHIDGVRATYFLTDGAVARPLDADVAVESVFEAADNAAITALDIRPGETLDSAGQAFLEVANYAKASQDVRITLTRGSVTVLDVHVDMAPGTATQRVVPLSRGGEPRVRARITAKANALVVDDEAVAWIPGAQPIVVTVVSDQAATFGPLLSKDQDVKATFVPSRNYTPGVEDVVIFDRVLPAKAPTVPALFIAPPGMAGSTWVGTAGADEKEPQWGRGTSHPLLQGVDTLTMAFDRARPYSGEGLVPVAFTTTNTPLAYVNETADQRFAVFTFSVTDSKLMFSPGFPVLLGNAIEWLAHPVPAGTRRPGPMTFVGALASLIGPNGQPVPVARIGDDSVARLSQLGFYEVRSGGASSLLAVNIGDPDVSDLQRTRLASATRTGASVPSRGRPWWLFAAAAALLLIAVEWFTWQRRVTV